MPAINDLHAQFRDRDDFALVAITKDTEDTLPKLMEQIAEHNIQYPLLWLGTDDQICERLREYASSIPAYILVNPDGIIIKGLD